MPRKVKTPKNKKIEEKTFDVKPLIDKLDELINKFPENKAPEFVVPNDLLNLPQKLDDVFQKNVNILNQTEKHLHQKQVDYYSLNTHLVDSQFSEIIQILQSLMNNFNSAIKNAIPTNIPEPHGNYFYHDESVTSDKSVTYDLISQLGRQARQGYIVSDSSTLFFRVNEGEKITLDVNDRQNFEISNNIRIYKIRIETDSVSADYRLYLE